MKTGAEKTVADYRKELADADFRQCQSVSIIRSATEFWQRWVRNENGIKLYAVNAYLYDFSQYRREGQPSDGIQFDVTLYKEGEESWFTLELHGMKVIAQALDFYRESYNLLGCCPDIHNN